MEYPYHARILDLQSKVDKNSSQYRNRKPRQNLPESNLQGIQMKGKLFLSLDKMLWMGGRLEYICHNIKNMYNIFNAYRNFHHQTRIEPIDHHQGIQSRYHLLVYVKFYPPIRMRWECTKVSVCHSPYLRHTWKRS